MQPVLYSPSWPSYNPWYNPPKYYNLWKYYPEKDIYRTGRAMEIIISGVSHKEYFGSTPVKNWVYLILGGEWKNFPDPGGLPDWK
jgi:hypothetical protein